ncbi:MAG TPA: hypothetical protein VEC37_01160 [Bacillota bacterium]|nr:hypothetical protein [Bacillota bacterium]
MAIGLDLLEIKEYDGSGYQPLITFQTWRVAVLKYCDELLPERIAKMQRHEKTDEVFILLQGKCLLYIGTGDTYVNGIAAQAMEPLRIYNVKRSAWHTHTLSRDAVVLIVENEDTAPANSPEMLLDEVQRQELVKLAREHGMFCQTGGRKD